MLVAIAAAALVLLIAIAVGTHQPTAAAADSAKRPPGTVPTHPVTLNWVGDMALSSEAGLPPGGLVPALAPVAGILRDADMSVGNLEGTLSAGGGSKCGSAGGGSCFAFQAPPAVAGQLKALGFGLVNQGNNHSMDYGPSGRAETIAALRSSGLPYTGLPGQITTLNIRGTRVAFLGFAPYRYTANLLDIPAAQALVRQARRQAQLVVVIIHAGAEGRDATRTPVGDQYFMGEDRGNARAFAHGVIDAGASIVLGSGPHVVRGVENYGGHMIAYSAGNFIGYHTLGHGGLLSESGILHVTLGAGGKVDAARWFSLALVDGLPRRDVTQTSAKFIGWLSDQDFPAGHFAIDGNGIFHV
jgi:Bacterial capsule synthesis protein PGA_cap